MRVILWAWLGAAATSAAADWQNTTWGMTVEEATAATGAVPNTDDSRNMSELEALLVLDYPLPGVAAEAVLLFDADQRLAFVSISPVEMGPTCGSLAALAEETYGIPDRQALQVSGLLSAWRDTENENLVTLTWSGYPADVVYCFVNYQPLPEPGAEGGL